MEGANGLRVVRWNDAPEEKEGMEGEEVEKAKSRDAEGEGEEEQEGEDRL